MTGNFWPAAEEPTNFTPAGGTAGLDAITGAAFREQVLVDNTLSSRAALEEAYANRSREIKAAIGVDLGNPLTLQRSTGDNAIIGSSVINPLPVRGSTAQRPSIDEYQARLEELARTADPDTRQVIGADRPVERDAEALARQADQQLGELMASNPSWPAAAASFLGSAGGSLKDPLVVGSMLVGGGPGIARGVLWGLVETGVKEALINGAATAAAQPSVQEWRRQAGLPHGFDQAAQNVLLSAALGGGLGVAGRGAAEAAMAVLRRVRPALSAEARAGLDAAEALSLSDAQRPEGVPAERHDVAVDRATQAVTGALEENPRPVLPPDEVEVSRIVNALAPAPESVSGRIESRTDSSIDRLVSEITEPQKAALGASTPILDHIRRLGGVAPNSRAASELRAAGVTARSIYRKGGLIELDNLPHGELPESVRFEIPDDGNGYASASALVDAAGREAAGYGAGRTVDDAAAIREHYERQGVDFAAPIDELRAQIRAVDDAEARYDAANGANGLSTDEVTHVPQALSRRQHTEQLVRQAMALQPGLPAEQIRMAVNLSLFEDLPIDEALSDVMSDAAGVPHTTPVDPLEALGTEPPPLLEERALAGEGADAADAGATLDFKALAEEFPDGLPFDDEIQSLEAISARLEESAWAERVVEACKA